MSQNLAPLPLAFCLMQFTCLIVLSPYDPGWLSIALCHCGYVHYNQASRCQTNICLSPASMISRYIQCHMVSHHLQLHNQILIVSSPPEIRNMSFWRSNSTQLMLKPQDMALATTYDPAQVYPTIPFRSSRQF